MTTTTLRVLILGGGFAGLEAAKALATAPVSVTLIDRQNHHCFQPLLYQVATAALTPADIAWPIRGILGRQRNARVLMADVLGVDPGARRVRTSRGVFDYDVLVVATGATHAYFGHEEWAPLAPGLKRIEDATAIRRRILMAFEGAEFLADPGAALAAITFVVVGGGPTGVEMAGAIANIARQALPPDFRNIDPAQARVLLIEAGPRILPTFPDDLSAYAAKSLMRMGVEVRTGAAVTAIDATGVEAGGERIAAGVVIWAAGVRASAAADWLEAPHDRAGRVVVDDRLNPPDRADIFVIGDTAAAISDGRPVPGLAPAAKQMGQYVARTIAARAAGRAEPGPFVYRHQGDLATLGRKAAIVKLGRFTLTGFPGWAFWSLAHVYFLIGVRNRIGVAFSWLWDWATFGRRARLITEPAAPPPPSPSRAAPSGGLISPVDAS